MSSHTSEGHTRLEGLHASSLVSQRRRQLQQACRPMLCPLPQGIFCLEVHVGGMQQIQR